MWSKIVSYIPDWTVFIQAAITLLFPIAVYYLYKHLYFYVGSGRSKNSGAKSQDAEPKNSDNHAANQQETEADHPPSKSTGFTQDYDDNLAAIRTALEGNSDVCFREFTVKGIQARAALVYVEGMQNELLINQQVLQNLMFASEMQASEGIYTYMKQNMLPLAQLNETRDLDHLQESVLFGYTALIVEGMREMLLVGFPHGAVRSITEPTSEALLRGPRIGFTEVLSENTSMLRRQGLNKHLEMQRFEVGSEIKKNLVIAYMKNIVNPDLLQEVKDRISKIDMDFILESGYVEQLIEDDYLSPFQQTQNTERPDRVIASLLEGRIAILLDGTPFALIVPVTFSMLLQSPEDYYERWFPGTLLRVLRFGAAFLALLAPALYISFISFHPGLIPTQLAISIIETRQGVPFPSLIEVLILEISIEILREAGIRLPKPIGPAMGIVGGLIIGDAAVRAGIVSPFLVIVVAVTAISSFSIPMYSAGITLRILRFAGMLFAAVLGMYGTILFFLLICSHLTRLSSFGVPYVTPISPFRVSDWKDLFVRAPLSIMKRRPEMLKTQKKKRKS
ncbi:spore germination protein [Paenibacillus sp. PastF-3]|uniref:spore germination protein n=1 Tax=unclassified Paenibacillus TaxID=185978 RepID=UPI000BA08500|nr:MULTISPECIES: spore germination protein [unclassified Paenibacillus]MDH6368947.1 spore germination protein [Paenibacillus sp. PastF-3]OZQ97509.1 spore germination protein [Paenibacillus sp. VTT E-133291]